MAEKKPLTEGYQPLQKGYQPTSIPPTVPTGDNVQGGYQPTTSEAKPAPVAPPSGRGCSWRSARARPERPWGDRSTNRPAR